eukprot:gene17516-22070_t
MSQVRAPESPSFTHRRPRAQLPHVPPQPFGPQARPEQPK